MLSTWLAAKDRTGPELCVDTCGGPGVLPRYSLAFCKQPGASAGNGDTVVSTGHRGLEWVGVGWGCNLLPKRLGSLLVGDWE